MWYVIQVFTGKELTIAQTCNNYIKKESEEVFVPLSRREIKVRGELVTKEIPMFPGYIFFDTEDAWDLNLRLKDIPAVTKLLRTDDEIVPVDPGEEEMLKNLGGSDHIVGMSRGIISGSEVRILSGPLKHYPARIIYIDRHKRVAYLSYELMGHSVKTCVGLEIIRKIPDSR